MATGHLQAVLRHIRKLAGTPTTAEVTDGQLLERFARQQDKIAFELLVRRHERMVWGVCRRLLAHSHDAEDAFQAAFVVLVRKAGTVWKRESVGCWLYQVAYRIALRLRANRAQIAARERQGIDPSAVDPHALAASLDWHDLRPILDQELSRLPEKYRAPVVLCYLEGKSYEEAAKQLGCPKGTVATRLNRARELLHERLTRRGFGLTVGLLATGLAQESASASVPVALVASTVRSVTALAVKGAALGSGVSAPVVTLAEGLLHGMFLTQMKLAMAVLLAVSLVAMGAGVVIHQSLLANTGQEKPPVEARPLAQQAAVPKPEDGDKQPRTEPATQAKNGLAQAEQPKESLTVNGRVLDPEGKPIRGARLYSPRWLNERPEKRDEIAAIQRGITDADGRFTLNLPRRDAEPDRPVTLVAEADGFGLDWVELPEKGESADVALRLIKDVPIHGRIINLERKPIPGVAIKVNSVQVPDNHDDFLRTLQRDWRAAQPMLTKRLLQPLTKLLRVRASDKDGRLEIAGTGADWVLSIEMIGDTIPRGHSLIINHEGLDLQAINKTIAKDIRGPFPVYGPSFEHVADLNRVIEGTVREAGTGKPIPGVTLQADDHTTSSNQPVTDARGRYRFLGLRRSPVYTIWFDPPKGTPLIGRHVRVTDIGSPLEPIQADVELPRGVIVNGRVFDQATGKGVASRVHFHALPGNQFANTVSHELSLYTWTDDDGRFRLVSIPGPGVLAAETVIRRTGRNAGVNPYLGSIYKPGKFNAEDRKRVRIIQEQKDFLFIIAGGVFGLDSYNVYRVVDLKEGETASCDLGVDPGRTLSVNLEDPEGKPLTGVTAWGVTAMRSGGIALTSDTCPVYALDPETPRQLAFLHHKRGLAAAVSLRGDEPGRLTVRLKPTGVITGRALDADGQPMGRATVGVRYASRWGDQMVFALQRRDELPRADEHGRFRVEGIVPGLKFDLGFIDGRQAHFLPKTWLEVKPLEAGQTLDLGDIRVRPPERHAEDSWRYVVPEPGAAFANPPPRPLLLSDRKPADLKESVSYRGHRQRYGQLIYGTGRQAVVSIVVDEVAPNDVDLYVDADRNGEITAKDRVQGENLMWRVRLHAVVPEGIVLRQLPRRVFFRYDRAGQTLSVATCGYWEGQVLLNGKSVTVRRVDGDANGLLADAEDSIWIAIKGNDTRDAAYTEFRFAPILRLGEQRFAVCADEYGKRLHLAPLQGTGTLQLALPETVKPDQVEEIQVRMQSRDGVMVVLRNLEAAVTVPSGDYRVSSLRLTLKDPKNGPVWGYIFGDNDGKASRWHRLDTSGTLTIDPIGRLDFTAPIGEGKREARAGELLSVSPALYTGDGLLIERAYRDSFQSARFDSGCAGQIVLAGEGGRILDSARTGFA